MRLDVHHIPLFRDLSLRSSELSGALCETRFSGDASCDWYHAAWPVLRLINAVSTPYWHLNFYDFAFNAIHGKLSNEDLRFIVVGAADFSMAAVIHESAQPVSSEITVLDQCGTALSYADHWAKTHHISLKTQKKSVLLTDPGDLERFDIAVSDALLTRFPHSSRGAVLSAIRRRLRRGGVLVTTVRDHSRLAPKLNEHKHLIDQQGLTTQGQYDLAQHGFDATTLAVFNEMVRQYCKRMQSFTFMGLDEANDLAKHSGFRLEYAESCATPGEFQETTYLRLIFRCD